MVHCQFYIRGGHIRANQRLLRTSSALPGAGISGKISVSRTIKACRMPSELPSVGFPGGEIRQQLFRELPGIELIAIARPLSRRPR